ncbi:MAG: PqiC family protein [Gammaproteobacteria bacterium]|jgi:uncharacterized lipoprotein YmbA
MNTCRPDRLLLVAALVAAVTVGCATPTPARFYTLSETPVAAPVGRLAADRTLAVGPVDLPEYLDRPQIVTRIGDSELQVNEFHRWGGVLQEEATRVVARDLARLLDTRRVHVYPSRVSRLTDYRVVIELRSFEGTLGGEVVLDAAWTILDERTAEPLHTGFSRARAMAAGPGFDAYTRALSEVLGGLGRAIATELARLDAARR